MRDYFEEQKQIISDQQAIITCMIDEIQSWHGKIASPHQLHAVESCRMFLQEKK